MIKQATEKDISILAELAIHMWETHTRPELEVEFTEIINNKNAVCYITYSENTPVGFSQCQLRNDYVEGTETSPVGYLEGVFVLSEYRHKVLQRNFYKRVKHGLKQRGVRNLQVIVN